MEQCLLVKTHLVKKGRMPYHLMKCKRQHHRRGEIVHCWYNHSHAMMPEELMEHEKHCKNAVPDVDKKSKKQHLYNRYKMLNLVKEAGSGTAQHSNMIGCGGLECGDTSTSNQQTKNGQ
ncbi:unnamed protein product [Owenia fusiformis]|uniref:CHHC U11-48K-type domain-containing protein n=1 Tax=Owenia fusiformis TaxID=6347 RepID=A0A8S4PWR9_OWEFU|nr:unnamed protein product [Owenia fusiformis]